MSHIALSICSIILCAANTIINSNIADKLKTALVAPSWHFALFLAAVSAVFALAFRVTFVLVFY